MKKLNSRNNTGKAGSEQRGDFRDLRSERELMKERKHEIKQNNGESFWEMRRRGNKIRDDM